MSKSNLEAVRDHLAELIAPKLDFLPFGHEFNVLLCSKLIETIWGQMPVRFQEAISSSANALPGSLVGEMMNRAADVLRATLAKNWLLPSDAQGRIHSLMMTELDAAIREGGGPAATA